jgi:hypothetical protein
MSGSLIQGAARSLSQDCCTIVLETLVMTLEEAPRFLFAADDYNREAFAPQLLSSAPVAPPLFLPFMKLAISIILHGLYGNFSVTSYARLFYCARLVIRRFGYKLFASTVGDSMQDWARACLLACANRNSSTSQDAADFLLYLLRASFHYTGSLTLLTNVILSVFDDVITKVLHYNKAITRTYLDEDTVLEPLLVSIIRMQMAAEVRSKRGSRQAALSVSIINLMKNLRTLWHASAHMRRHVSHPVGHDWLGSNMLDGPFEDYSNGLMLTLRNARRAVGTAPGQPKADLESVMEGFAAAAEIFDPVALPRHRIRWLENLARVCFFFKKY